MTWKKRLRHLLRKNETDAELDEELRFHLDHQIEEYVGEGMAPEEARWRAMREFGIVEQVKEECRESRGLVRLEELWQNLRYAWRNCRRNPSFALTVVAVTAVGIGSTTAVFSVVDRVLFRGLPYAESERLVALGMQAPILEYDFLTASAFFEMQRTMGPLQAVTAISGTVDCDLKTGELKRLSCARVDSTFLPAFGVQPVLGRNFTAEEDRPHAPNVALLTHGLWKAQFGGQADAIGRRVELDGMPYLVVGVLPENFEMPSLEKADLVIPHLLDPATPRGMRPLRVFGRLRPDVSVAQAAAAFQPVALRLLEDAPPQYRNEIRFRVRPLREYQSGDVRSASWTLLAAVLAILLIACANVANLLVARSLARGREFAVRVALGAGRGRLMEQTLTESLLLSLCGGAAGCVLAEFLLRVFVAIAPAGMPHLADAGVDLRVLGFAVAGSVVCGLLFGWASAWHVPDAKVLTGARVTGGSAWMARHVLVGAQIAGSLVLLTVAGLLMQSLWARQNLSLGVQAESTVTSPLALTIRYAQPAARMRFYEDLEQRLGRLPGVEAVAVSDTVPPGGVTRTQPFFALQAEGHPPYERGVGGVVAWRSVTPDYFRALGIPLMRGRGFTEEDRAPKAAVIILSQALARNLFPGEDPLGRHVVRFPKGPPHEVVGIAADVRNAGLTDESNPEYYVVRRHVPEEAGLTAAIVVRGPQRQAVLASWIRSEVAALDGAIPVAPRAFQEHVGELAARPRFQAWLLALFACIGLLLASAGLYGLISYLVVQREREIGVRLALGATPKQIAAMVLGHALRWTAGGLAAGAAGAALAAWGLRRMLFHVSPASPSAFGGAAVVLLGLALLAAWGPTRRAAGVDPMLTLRQD